MPHGYDDRTGDAGDTEKMANPLPATVKLIPSENQVIKQIRDMIWLNGGKAIRITERIPDGKHRVSEAGTPDLLCWLTHSGVTPYKRPFVFLVEVKRPGGKLRPSQIQFLEEAKKDGIVAFKAESWDDVKVELKRYGINLKVE